MCAQKAVKNVRASQWFGKQHIVCFEAFNAGGVQSRAVIKNQEDLDGMLTMLKMNK